MSLNDLLKTNDLIKRAYDFAKKAHEGQKRKTGEPYIIHPIAAAEHLISWGMLDETTIAAALLHDVAEDTPFTIEDIEREFGPDVTFLVSGVTKLGHVKYRGIEARVENLRKFILALSKDIRVILVKLADRLHNMETLGALPPQKQKRIALETMEIYAPLAYRLGMHHLSGELEDLAFPYIYPKEHEWLIATVKDKYEERALYAERLKPLLETALRANNIPFIRIDSRAKRYTSLYKKLLKYDMDINQIHDLVATRIVVPTVADCYSALGVIHKLYPPVSQRFKDYIALPKPNGYQSIHTTVFGPEKHMTEVQIRTALMHDQAEHGIAAHWAYSQQKDSKAYLRGNAIFADTKSMAWVQQLANWQEHFTNPQEFLDSLKIDFFQDRILALTPRGEVIDLPAGATPIDFAYQIHTDIGNAATGARVNSRIVPLHHKLSSGDMVEIIIQKNKKPSGSWLEFVKTGFARSHIKSALRKKETVLTSPIITKTEFKLTVREHPELLGIITDTITRSHVNVVSLTPTGSDPKSKLLFIKAQLPLLTKDKAEKLQTKLKSIKEVKEISFRFL